MKINFNASAVIATNSMTRNDNRLQQSLERLSSGLKIVHAKDNPSGLAMAKRMNAQIEGVTQATQNAGDGISVVEIADGALAEVHEMLQRINELAVKSSTGSLTSEDREMIQVEVKQLKEEISRVSRDTEFNGQRILDGSFDLKGYTNNENVKVTYYSDTLKTGYYQVGLDVTYKADGTIEEAELSTTPLTPDPAKPAPVPLPNDAKVTQVDGNIVTIKGSQNFELKLRIDENAGNTVAVDMEITGFGSMDMQIGANEGQQLDIIIPEVSLENMGIKDIDLSTEEGSDDALGRMGEAIHFVSAVRGRLGAYQNRLEHTINTLDITNENMTGAYSRIMDADMAEEMTEYTTLQVLAQASTSMLAQANERPSQVLQLLQ